VLAGDFTIVNAHLVRDLIRLGMWNPQIKNEIIRDRGSVQNLEHLPQELKDLYKTVWEVKQKRILELAADRGAFIDQSQSMNIHIAYPTPAKVTSMHFTGWKLQLKTGMYYLRSRPKSDPIAFTVEDVSIPTQSSPLMLPRILTNSSTDSSTASSMMEEQSSVGEDEEGLCLSCGS
jgi:ribonucleoside-diphosphate reductase subunit M1